MTKILLVEDNELNQDMLMRRLKKRGYEVSLAEDGLQAIEMATSEIPELILMDLRLPNLDGWEATRQIKSNEKTKHIPVIALTADAMPSDKEAAIQAGCDDYHSKPIELKELLEQMNRLLEKTSNSN